MRDPKKSRFDFSALVFATVLPTVATWLYYWAYTDPSQVQPLYAACKVLQFSFPLLWVYWIRKSKLRFRNCSAQELIRGVVTGIILSGLILGMYYLIFKGQPWIQSTPLRLQEKITTLGFGTLPKFLLLAIFISLIHSFLEEYYWRWFVFREMEKRMKLWPAAFLSALGFTSHHVLIIHAYVPYEMPKFFSTFLFSLMVVVGGVVWALQYARSRSLWEVWISHLLVDAALMWLAVDLVWGV